MSELETPSIAAFNILIDAHMHAKATSAKPTSSCGSQANKQKSAGQGGQNSGRGRNTVSDKEKKRRQIMQGKCFRCGSADHFANSCSLAKDIKCKTCNTQGHIATACSGGGNNSLPPKLMRQGRKRIKTVCVSWSTDQLTTKTNMPKLGLLVEDVDIIIHPSQFPSVEIIITVATIMQRVVL